MNEHHLDLFNGVAIPYFNFFLFVAMFIFFFRKSLAQYIQGRRSQYLSTAEIAQKRLIDAKKSFDDVKSRFDALDEELKTFKKQSEELAQLEAQRITADGDRLAEQILRETQRVANEEIERAKHQLRLEIVAEAKAQAENDLKSLSHAAKAEVFAKKLSVVQTLG